MARRNIEYRTPAIEAYYREHRTRWDHFYESERVVFEKLGLGSASAVLDVGCGCGGLGLALRERFGVQQYTGVEINRQAAQTAQLMNPTGRFLRRDILELSPVDLAEESFDVVASLSCIDWNIQFAEMLAKAYRYVRAGGYFVSSFRLTSGESLIDTQRSYQYVNFHGKREGEVAPYVVLNFGELLGQLKSLAPSRIVGFGYFGAPSPTTVTPVDKVVFAVIAVQKRTASAQDTVVDLDLPPGLLGAEKTS
jgi:SAM-dependent methyltransferase